MDATMQDEPLTISRLFWYGRRVHGSSQVLTFDGEKLRPKSFAQVAERVERLAAGLARLGVEPGDRVASLMWTTNEHLEAYFAVPGMGAVLHTLNLRLFPDQLVHIINEAEDRVIIVHATVLPLLARIAAHLPTVRHYLVVDDRPSSDGSEAMDPALLSALTGSAAVTAYEDLLAGEQSGYVWPEVDERSAALMCYTSGTTGDPQGVVYSHRSTFLHTFGLNNSGLHVDQRDRALVVVPMFHVNAWGFPYSGWINGCDLVLPSRYLQGEPLAQMIEDAGVTFSAGVPTIWAQLLAYVDANPGTDLSSLRLLVSGGAALPPSLISRYDALGVRMIQGWGLTETSPMGAVGEPPKNVDRWDMTYRSKTGRVVPGIELRIVDREGAELPWDGESVGEIEVRGPWVIGSYYGGRNPERFHDGWFRTGDIASVDSEGFVTISDRLKDVIKSGGEWISSVDLENEIMNHPAVAEAMVIGIPDDRWGERPLAVVVPRPGQQLDAVELRDWLEPRVARWWVPENWSFADELPKTSVGKFNKKLIRDQEAAGEIEVIRTS